MTTQWFLYLISTLLIALIYIFLGSATAQNPLGSLADRMGFRSRSLKSDLLRDASLNEYAQKLYGSAEKKGGFALALICLIGLLCVLGQSDQIVMAAAALLFAVEVLFFFALRFWCTKKIRQRILSDSSKNSSSGTPPDSGSSEGSGDSLSQDSPKNAPETAEPTVPLISEKDLQQGKTVLSELLAEVLSKNEEEIESTHFGRRPSVSAPASLSSSVFIVSSDTLPASDPSLSPSNTRSWPFTGLSSVETLRRQLAEEKQAAGHADHFHIPSGRTEASISPASFRIQKTPGIEPAPVQNKKTAGSRPENFSESSARSAVPAASSLKKAGPESAAPALDQPAASSKKKAVPSRTRRQDKAYSAALKEAEASASPSSVSSRKPRRLASRRAKKKAQDVFQYRNLAASWNDHPSQPH